MEITNEKIVTWTEAKKILEQKAKEKELGYEQKNALEHLRKFCKVSEKKTADMSNELEKIGRLKRRHIVIITNMLPQNADELRMLFANETVNISDEDKKKILNIVKKFS